jgi:hypothetical protein
MRAVVLVVVGMASILAGCGEVSAAATESTETSEGELIASSSAVTQTISGGGVCTDVKALFEANADAVKALCADGEVAIPTAHDAEGCDLGQVKSLTLSCVTPKLPKDGEGKCFDLPVKPPKDKSDADGDKACHEPSAPKPENLPAVLCPKLGAEPPPDGAGPGGDHKGPPPPPPGDKPEAGADGQHPAPPAGGPKADGDKHAGPKAGGDKGARPPLRCCLPPKGGKDGKPPPPKGGPAGGPASEQAGASAEGEGAQGLQ